HGVRAHRRVHHPRGLQPRPADVHMDCLHVGQRLPGRRLESGLCGRGRPDRDGGHAGGRSLALLHLPVEGLMAIRTETLRRRSQVARKPLSRQARRRSRVAPIAKHAVLIFACVIVLFPIAWVFLLSIKSLPDAYTNRIWPHHFDFSHYGEALSGIDTLRQNFTNSVIVTTSTMLLTSFVAVLAGYALVHLRPPGRGLVLSILVASLFIPTRVTGIISIYQIQNDLGLINSTWGLILPYQTLALAVSVFIMRGVFETIPKE